MRIRRKPFARPELAACEFFIDESSVLKGNVARTFKRLQPLHVELGCGKGRFISRLSCEKSEINFLAIDIKSEMLVLAKRNIEARFAERQRDIDNVFLMAQNIERISGVLGQDDNVERIYINFCNPWPKERHKKRRLTHSKQLLQYRSFLMDGGEIHFKTDDIGLFEESLCYFNENGFDIVYKTYDLHRNGPKDNISTEHEEMFAEKGIKINFLIAKMCGEISEDF